MTIDLPALADLIGVTPETHPHLNNQAHCSDYGCGFTDAEQRCLTFVDHCNCMVCQQCGAEYPVSMNLPGPDQPEAFDNWALAPLMRWMQEHDHNPSIVGLDFGHITKFTFAADCFSLESMRRTANVYDDCMTLALLHAARAAGVPEIVALFKEDEQ
jgi:hypothetical protein